MNAPTDAAAVTPPDENELLANRRANLAKMREFGVEPFGGKYETTHAPGALQEVARAEIGHIPGNGGGLGKGGGERKKDREGKG